MEPGRKDLPMPSFTIRDLERRVRALQHDTNRHACAIDSRFSELQRNCRRYRGQGVRHGTGGDADRAKVVGIAGLTLRRPLMGRRERRHDPAARGILSGKRVNMAEG